MNMFRTLRHDEIDCRISQIKKNNDGTPKGLSLLLYKDARCDQNILDETVGPMSWKREHTRDNKNCIVSVWDSEKQQWISKEDTGTESNTEKEKGLASDSFKRACFNWGIGRELYTAPYIWVKAGDCNIKNINGKMVCYDNFTVSRIEYKDGVITEVQIRNESTGKICYSWKSKAGEDKPARPDNAPDEANIQPSAKTNITTTDKVPVDTNSTMGYLQNELSFYAADAGTTAEGAKAAYKVTLISMMKAGELPNKPLADYSKDEIDRVLNVMRDNIRRQAS